MNKHLDEYLCKKYPKIFEDRHKPMSETCMCWGFSCESGWFYLIDQLCADIQQHVDTPQWVDQWGNSIKQLYNSIMWNRCFYHIAKLVAFGEFPNLKRSEGFVVSVNKNSKRQWAVYNWFCKWFQFNIKCVRSNVPVPQLVADQVKEKFGTLRFYYHGGDEYCRSIISFAESLSSRICEVCGRTDELVATHGRNWVRTTCPCCAKKEDRESHKKSLNTTLVKLWEKVREEESQRTTESDIKEAIKTVAEVKGYGKKKKSCCGGKCKT